MQFKRLSLLVAVFALAAFLSGCAGKSSPTVVVTAAATTVDGTNSISLTATVTNDVNSAGVTWAITGGGALSAQTITSATYTAPAATAAPQTIIITATSIAETSKSGTATITIPAAPAITSTGANLATAVGATFSVSLAGSGGIAPYTWTLTAGSLPACVTMTSAGVISGTITAACAGSYTPTFTMRDSGTPTALTASQQITMVIAAAPAITFTGTVPATGTYNVAYSGSSAATGGSGALSYALTAGSTLPTGVTLNAATGAISGTPTTTGAFSFAVRASDAFGDSATSATYSLAISYPAMQITTAALPTGYIGSAYTSTQLTATGGAGVASNYTWSMSVLAPLPFGLGITPSGLISGTPTGPVATSSVTLTVTDSTSTLSATVTLSLQVKSAVTITALALPTGYVGSVYNSTQLTATGGSGVYSTWVLSGGTTLPAGLSLSTSGLISGTPTGPTGSPSFTVRVTDSAANTATASFSITVAAGVTITTPTALADGYPGAAYTPVTLAAAGGTGTYSNWAVTSGSVPAGMTLSAAGQLSGTPTTAGNSSFTVRVTDSAANTASATFSLTVEAILSVTQTSLPAAATGILYSQTLTASGGSGGYTWAISGSAPNTLSTYNLTLTGAGLLSGTPGNTGTATFTAVVTDSASHTASQAFSITVSNMTISTTTLPYGVTGSAYSQTLVAAGGVPPYTWTQTGGTLPTGTTLSSAGVLSSSGNLTATGAFTFTVRATDANSLTATMTYTVHVYNPLTFTTTALGSAIYNAPYSANIQTSGGSGTFTWKVNNAAVTAGAGAVLLASGHGLTGQTSGGAALAIAGTPNAYGSISLAVQITDSVTTSTASRTFTVDVASLTVSVDPQSVPQGMVGMPYTFNNVDVQNGTPPFTITYTNAPAGMATNSNQLVGAPTASGSTTVTANVTDNTLPTHQIGSTTFALPVVDQTVGTANSKLNGQYACYVERFWYNGVLGGNGTSTLYRGGMIFAFIANGGGGISGGEADSNSPGSGGYRLQTGLTGTYAIGADNRGYMLMGSGASSMIFSVAGANLASNLFQELALTEMDDAGATPSGKTATGHCYKQVTTALTGIRPTGGSVFGLHGESMTGNTESVVGQVVFTGSTAASVQDMVNGTTLMPNQTFSGTITTTDSFGRLVMSVSGVDQSVVYLTNNAKGDSLIMNMPAHNGASNADFMIGTARAQSATNIAANYPVNGNAVMYLSGSDTVSGSATTYQVMAAQLTGSNSAKQIVLNSIIENVDGTFTLNSAGSPRGQTMVYTTDTSTGKMTITGQTGIYFYLYDTSSAVILFANSSGSGGRQNQVGWMEPQITSGAWDTSDIASTSMISKIPNENYDSSWMNGVVTAASNGVISNFAQDSGSSSRASWSEPLSGSPSVSATGALVLNATDGASYGLFDINMTVGGSTSTQVDCYAISVAASVNSATKAKLVCMDRSGDNPTLTIIQE